MKYATVAISLVVLIGCSTTSTASALVNYQDNWYAGQCMTIDRDLSYGARGSDVSQVQSFLVGQNYPGSGTWMVTGFFGGATQAAVRDFQQAQGLSMTGTVDAPTRAAISSASCGGSSSYTAPGTVYSSTVPWNAYNSNYSYSNLVNLNLTSLSQNTGAPGSEITIYGTGFDPLNNTITFGSVALTNVPSNGTSMTFIVPSYTFSGSVNITVTNLRGVSNALSFTVYSYGSTCGNNYFYAYGSCGCNSIYPTYAYGSYYNNYGNLYNNYRNCGTNTNSSNLTAPVANYLNPTSGGTGTSVTLLGSGFTATSNAVHFGTGIIANLPSNDGQSVSFTVPTQLAGYGTQNTGLGVYDVSVTNGIGYTTNTLPFTVTALGTSGGILNNGTPTISYLSPSVGRVGTSVTIYGSNLYNITAILFGNGAIENVYAQNGSSLTFTVPSSISPYCAPGMACAQYLQLITPGTYNVSVMTTSGTSNSTVFTVQQ